MMPVSDTEYTAMKTAEEGKAPPGRSLVRKKTVADIAVNSFQKWISPKWVDAIIAGSFLTAAALLLHLVDLYMGKNALPLYNGGMLTSSIIFFGGPTPPPAKGFTICTVGSWLLGYGIRFLGTESVGETCLGAGLLLVFFKMAGGFFPPTLGVAVYLISDPTGQFANPVSALRWLLTPWLAGSAILYGVAHLAAMLRKQVRTSLSKAKFKATLADSSDEKLREVFNRERRSFPTASPVESSWWSLTARLCLPRASTGYDTSGDGFLQAGELKFAWQVVTGEEMTEAEAQALVESVDTDGNNEIDPDEFIALVRENMD